MAYIELILEVERNLAEALSDSLIEAGALSASVEDADAGGVNEQPLFGEPGGEPLEAAWNRSIIVALFDDTADVDGALEDACIEAGLDDIPVSTRREVAEQDWVRLTQAQFDPIHVGERLWIVPSWHDTPTVAADRPDALILQLDPGLAFGTGSHPTTRLCMAWLEANLKPGASVIDYGCGSGILAIAAKKLGAGKVVGTDIDAHAISASITNAAINRVVATFIDSHDFHAAPANVVVANILSNPLKVLAPLLCDLVGPNGSLVLSGILERQWQEVAAVYAPMIELRLWRAEDGWVCLAGTRKAVEATEASDSSDSTSAMAIAFASATTPEAPLSSPGLTDSMIEADPFTTPATRCPACETVFRLTPDAARARDGMVRCGVCAHPFNALHALVDTALPAASPVTGRQEAPAILPAQVSPHQNEPLVMTAVPDETIHFIEATSDGSTITPDPENAGPEVAETEATESTALAPDAAEPAGAEIPEPEAPDSPPEPEPVETASEKASENEPDSEAHPETVEATRLDTTPEPRELEQTPPIEASFLKQSRRKPSSRATRIVIGVSGFIALLALAGQASFLWRNEIAALWPPARPWLAEACIALRCDIGTPAHIERLSIVSAELQSLPEKDTYVYTALLRNRSIMAQRYPAIELALTDAQDQPLLRRVITPAQYLPAELRARLDRGIAANSELPVRIVFEAPGNRATGFKSALFYP